MVVSTVNRRPVVCTLSVALLVLLTASSALPCLSNDPLYDMHSRALFGVLLRDGKPLAHEPLEIHKKLRPDVPIEKDGRYDAWAWGNTRTGDNGEFSFGKLPPGIYYIRTSTKDVFPVRLVKPDRQHPQDGLLLELRDEWGCSRVYVRAFKRK